MEEIEVKFLNIDPARVESQLTKLGARREFSRVYRVIIFDHPDLRLHHQASWVRLRDEGDQITLAFKQRQGVVDGQNDTGMIEHEVTVSDFETTANILRSAGLTEKFQEEKRRTRWRLNTVEVDIDEMPLLKPFLEIEADSWDQIGATVKALGLNPDDQKICSAYQVYGYAGIKQLDYQILTFDRQVKRPQH
jgi:adenylate cyclase class 2